MVFKWQNRKKRSTNNGEMAETAERPVSVQLCTVLYFDIVVLTLDMIVLACFNIQVNFTHANFPNESPDKKNNEMQYKNAFGYKNYIPKHSFFMLVFEISYVHILAKGIWLRFL